MSWPEDQPKYVPERNDGITRVVRLRIYKGKIIQDCDVYIGRHNYNGGWNLSSSKWENPYKVNKHQDRQTVIEMYKKYIMGKPELMKALPELKGKRLGCWCKPEMCHGDVLVQLLNLSAN